MKEEFVCASEKKKKAIIPRMCQRYPSKKRFDDESREIAISIAIPSSTALHFRNTCCHPPTSFAAPSTDRTLGAARPSARCKPAVAAAAASPPGTSRPPWGRHRNA